MASKDTAIRALCKSLGKEYRVCTIDFEPVIYRDFGNGFNVEISGVYTTSKTRKATLYLWYGEEQPECLIVKTVRDVQRDEIFLISPSLLVVEIVVVPVADIISQIQCFSDVSCFGGRSGSFRNSIITIYFFCSLIKKRSAIFPRSLKFNHCDHSTPETIENTDFV